MTKSAVKLARPAASDGRTAAADAFTDLLMEIFRFSGRLLAAGDRLTKDLDLTSARWQVMGAIDLGALTVPQIARYMGLQRQSVQRVVDLLTDEGVVELLPNPHHARAKLVSLTREGRGKLMKMRKKQHVWSNRITEGMQARAIHEAHIIVKELRERLEKDEPR